MTEDAEGVERPPIDRLPLTIWAAVAGLSVVARSLASPGGPAVDRWDALSQWASTAHLELADHGYRVGAAFVMPGYAGLVRALTWLTGGRVTTAVLVSYAASAVASWLFWEWMAGRGIDRRTRVWSLLVLLVFPYSFILYGVVAADSLVLALVLGAFLLVDRDRPWLAGLVVAGAVLTQITAAAVVPALVVAAWTERRRAPGAAESVRSRRAAIGATVGAATAAIGLSVSLGLAVGDAGWPWRGDGALAGLSLGVFQKATWIRLTWLVDDTPTSWTFHRGAQAMCMIAVVVAAYRVAKRFGAGYGTFVAGVSFMTLLGFADTASSGARLTLAFPVAALAGGVLARRPAALAGAAIVASTAVMVCFYVLFVRSVGAPYW